MNARLRPLLAAPLAALLAASAAAQQSEYHFDIDQFGGLITWELDLNIGPVTEQPPKVNLDGQLVLELDSPTAPWTSGQLHASLIRVVPTTVVGVVPNPVPFLPALGSMTISALQASIASDPFTIDANGNFTANATMRTSAGTASTTGQLGNLSGVPLAGMYQIYPGIPITGFVEQVGSTLHLHIDLNVDLPNVTPGGSITGSISFVGPLDAYASTTMVDPMTVVVPHPLVVGGGQVLELRNGTPTLPTVMTASKLGLGATNVPQFGVILDLTSPFKVGNTLFADANGDASWTVSVPPGAVGLSLWFQAIQLGTKSNVLGTWVE